MAKKTTVQIPLVGSPVMAGFPSPADDYIEQKLSLDAHLIPHPAATFIVRAAGDSMIDAGITAGDLLIVDRSVTSRHNDIVIAVLDGEFTVKTLYKKNGRTRLIPANKKYQEIHFDDSNEVVIWGVVTYVIHGTR
jgi:DNA polymerase V